VLLGLDENRGFSLWPSCKAKHWHFSPLGNKSYSYAKVFPAQQDGHGKNTPLLFNVVFLLESLSLVCTSKTIFVSISTLLNVLVAY
jgi:hypothetical protein